MVVLLLAMIYLSFLGMGLNTPMMGTVWPLARLEFGSPLSDASYYSLCAMLFTLIGVSLTGKAEKHFGTGKSVAIGLLGIGLSSVALSQVPGFFWMVLIAAPIGCSIALLDILVNNYVAVNFKPQFMSWLHCFWGAGALISPNIASVFLKQGQWRQAFFTVGVIQLAITAGLFLIVPLWAKYAQKTVVLVATDSAGIKKPVLSIPGAKGAVVAFFCIAGIETCAIQWGSSFLVNTYQVPVAQAATWISLFFGGITAARFLSGFLAMRFAYKKILAVGQLLAVVAATMLLFPLHPSFLAAGFILFGLGCGPVAPGLLHLTPERFGRENSPAVFKAQITASYVGSMVLPALVGQIGARTTMLLLPVTLLAFAVLMLLVTQMGSQKPEQNNLSV